MGPCRSCQQEWRRQPEGSPGGQGLEVAGNSTLPRAGFGRAWRSPSSDPIPDPEQGSAGSCGLPGASWRLTATSPILTSAVRGAWLAVAFTLAPFKWRRVWENQTLSERVS